MQYVRHIAIICTSLFAAPLFAAAEVNPDFDKELLSIQQAWAKVNYETPAGGARKEAFDALVTTAKAKAGRSSGPAIGQD